MTDREKITALRVALKDVTDHLAAVMAGPMVQGRGVVFADGVEGIPTIKRARAVLEETR